MKFAITGSGGLLGRALAASLAADGHEVLRLVRRAAAAPDEVGYDPETDIEELDLLEGCRAVVHLAGADPGARAWDDAARAAFQGSRYEPTRKVCQNVAVLRELPEVLVSVSSLAFYGSRPGEELDERSRRGDGAWAEFIEDWEFAAEMVEAVGMRLVQPRLAPVIAPGVGLVAALEAAHARGRGPLAGPGTNRVPYVRLADAVRALRHVIDTTSLERGVVVAAPDAPTQADLARALLGEREFAAPMTADVARRELGDVLAEAWLADRRCEPRALVASGFCFGGG